MKEQPYRAIKINGIDKELVLSRLTVVKVEKQFFHLDQLPDGTWRITVSEDLIPDMTKVSNLEIVRR